MENSAPSPGLSAKEFSADVVAEETPAEVVAKEITADLVAKEITRIISTSPEPSVPGTLVAASLKLHIPEFRAANFGCRNLKDFIARYAGDLMVVGHAGLDARYGMKSSGAISRPEGKLQSPGVAAPATETSSPKTRYFDAEAFRAYASPSGVFAAYVNRQTGELRAQAVSSAELGGDWVRIPSLSREDHVDMARRFVESLPDKERNELEPLIGAGQQWHVAFWEATRGLNLEPAWKKSRSDRIAVSLTKALEALGVPLRATSSLRRPTHVSAPSPESLSRPGRAPDFAKLLAVRAVERMSIRELRGLRLTLGEFIDAFPDG